MDPLIKICALLIVSLVAVNMTAANSVDNNNHLSDEDFQTIVVVRDLEILKTLIQQISQLQGMNATYDGVLNRQIVEKSLKAAVNYEVPQNSYALVIKTKDASSNQAIEDFLRQYTSMQQVNIQINVGNRTKRISGLIAVGTALIAAVNDAVNNPIKGTDPYGKIVMSATATGLALFSAGMAAVSIIPNPITPAISAVSGALSLGINIAKNKIYD